MKLFIIRHADPDYENDTITKFGEKQAKELAKRMAKENLSHVYSSPMGRALKTAGYTASAIGKNITVEEWTHEIDGRGLVNIGDGPGFAPWNTPGEKIRENEILLNSDSWRTIKELNIDEILPVYEKIKEESDIFFEKHGLKREGGRYRILKPNDDNIALFCHGGFGLTWLAHILNIPLPLMWSGFVLCTTSVTTILFDKLPERFGTTEWAVPKCFGLCNQSHLYSKNLFSSR